MRRFWAALLLTACGLVCGLASAPALAAADSGSMRVASYNLRYLNPDDGANAWPLRKERVSALIRFHGFDVFGTQEGLAQQLDDLAQMDEYAHAGVGRDDGQSAGDDLQVRHESL